MSRIFVCSPFRGPDGQPSQTNIALARRLMRAVFDAGHAPFVPHLLYPQVLSESEEDLKKSFAANYAFLDSCSALWVYARDLNSCSKGMRLEVEYAAKWQFMTADGSFVGGTRIEFMPTPFEAVERELASGTGSWHKHGIEGPCTQCANTRELNRAGWCFDCFSGVGPR